MQGPAGVPELKGVIPNSFSHIFEFINASRDIEFLVRCSYLEIYNEEIKDLLGDQKTQLKCELKEDPQKGVFVKNLTDNIVHSEADMDALLTKGVNNRTTGATLMNQESSRSHSIFTIVIEMSSKNPDTGKEQLKAGKLNLVDLAGSERQKKTGATGDRLKEGSKINLSLSALGNVISALSEGKDKHIPYRDSKLTRMLQDSLGGNTKTLMVAAISPADYNYDETMSTLRYANRAKNIKNKPKINEDPKDTMLREYKMEIERLRKLLAEQASMHPAQLAAYLASNGMQPSSNNNYDDNNNNNRSDSAGGYGNDNYNDDNYSNEIAIQTKTSHVATRVSVASTSTDFSPRQPRHVAIGNDAQLEVMDLEQDGVAGGSNHESKRHAPRAAFTSMDDDMNNEYSPQRLQRMNREHEKRYQCSDVGTDPIFPPDGSAIDVEVDTDTSYPVRKKSVAYASMGTSPRRVSDDRNDVENENDSDERYTPIVPSASAVFNEKRSPRGGINNHDNGIHKGLDRSYSNGVTDNNNINLGYDGPAAFAISENTPDRDKHGHTHTNNYDDDDDEYANESFSAFDEEDRIKVVERVIEVEKIIEKEKVIVEVQRELIEVERIPEQHLNKHEVRSRYLFFLFFEYLSNHIFTLVYMYVPLS